jgi:hypothetical protein
MTDSRATTLKDLLHLVDRARRGTILAPELDDLHAGITALHTKAAAAARAAAAFARVSAALDGADWGGPDRHDVIVEIRAALAEPKEAGR